VESKKGVPLVYSMEEWMFIVKTWEIQHETGTSMICSQPSGTEV
jgi:hypothetical protein